MFDAHKTEGDILAIVSKAEEFEQIKVKNFLKLDTSVVLTPKYCLQTQVLLDAKHHYKMFSE